MFRKRLGNRVLVEASADAAVPSWTPAEATRELCACVHAVVCGMKLADPGVTTNPGADSFAIQAGRRFHHRCCPWTQCGTGCVRGFLQCSGSPWGRRRFSEMKLWNCGNRAFTISLLFGQRMDDRIQPSLERFSTRQTLPPARTGSICRRNHFIASGNTKSK